MKHRTHHRSGTILPLSPGSSTPTLNLGSTGTGSGRKPGSSRSGRPSRQKPSKDQQLVAIQRLGKIAGELTLRTDPTRLPSVRRAFAVETERRLQALAGRLVKVLGVEDALGLGNGNPARNVRVVVPVSNTPGPHQYASTQFALPPDITLACRGLASHIRDADLAGDGRETSPHLTMLYGIHDDSPAGIAAVCALVADYGPLTVRLGPISLFPANDPLTSQRGGVQYDVVKIAVEDVTPAEVLATDAASDIRSLHGLHARLRQLPCTVNYPKYQPHITLAYVRPGEGRKYCGEHPLMGQTVTLRELRFMRRDGTYKPLSLTGWAPEGLGQRRTWDNSVTNASWDSERRDPAGRWVSGSGATKEEVAETEKALHRKVQEVLAGPNIDPNQRQYLGQVKDFFPGHGRLDPKVASTHVFYDPVADREDENGAAAMEWQHTPTGERVGGSTLRIGPKGLRGYGSSGSAGDTFVHEIEHLVDLHRGHPATEYTPRLRQMLRELDDPKDAHRFLSKHGRDEAEYHVDSFFDRHAGHSLTAEEREHAIGALRDKAKHVAGVVNAEAHNPEGCNQYSGPGCDHRAEDAKTRPENVYKALTAKTKDALPEGWEYAPKRLTGASAHGGGKVIARNQPGGSILVGDEFFAKKPGIDRAGLVYHELGHSIPAFSTENSKDTLRLLEPFKEGNAPTSIHTRYRHFSSMSGYPEEIVSDVYSEMMVGEMYQREAGREPRRSSEEPGSRYEKLEDHILKLAKGAGLPTPSWYKPVANLSSRELTWWRPLSLAERLSLEGSASTVYHDASGQPVLNRDPSHDNIAVDFDQTIADNPQYDLATATPRIGVRRGLQRFRRAGLPIYVHTANPDRQGIARWLDQHHIPYDAVIPKFAAGAYIDDRAVPALRRDGSWRDWEDIASDALDKVFGNPKQPVDSEDALYTLAETGQRELRKLLEKLVERDHDDLEVVKGETNPVANRARILRSDKKPLDLGDLEVRLNRKGTVILLPPIKDRERAREKVEEDYYGDWERLLDVVRAAVVCDTLDNLRETADALLEVAQQEGSDLADAPKDRFAEPLDTGYRDYLTRWRLPCGLIAEVQFHVKPMFLAKLKDELAYGVARAIQGALEREGREDYTPAEAEAIRKIKEGRQKIYARAWEECKRDSPTANYTASETRDEQGRWTKGAEQFAQRLSSRLAGDTGLTPAQQHELATLQEVTALLGPRAYTPEQLEAAHRDYKERGTRATAFKAWFGDWEGDAAHASKVVDDTTGEPKAQHKVREVYHGTTASFTEFNPKKIGDVGGTVAGNGFYFAEDPRIADTFAEAKGRGKGRRIKAYLNIRNPLDYDELVHPNEQEKWAEAAVKYTEGRTEPFKGGPYFNRKTFDDQLKVARDFEGTKAGEITAGTLWNILDNSMRGGHDTNKVVQSLGYDGITHRANDMYGSPSLPNGSANYGRCWVAFQPEQVKAVHNRGTFDPNDRNIHNYDPEQPRDEQGHWIEEVSDPERSHSDNMSFRELLRAGQVKEGVNVVEPYVYDVKDGKATIRKDVDAVYDYPSNRYRLHKRELPPEKLQDRTYTHGTEAPLTSAAELRPGKSYGNFGANEYNAIYLTQKGVGGYTVGGRQENQWGSNVLHVKLAPDTRLATSDQEIQEAWARHPQLEKQAALEAEGYHGVAKLDRRGDVWELALFHNRLQDVPVRNYDPRQPREHGRFAALGGGTTSSPLIPPEHIHALRLLEHHPDPVVRNRVKEVYHAVATKAIAAEYAALPRVLMKAADQYVSDFVRNTIGQHEGIPNVNLVALAASWGLAKAWIAVKNQVARKVATMTHPEMAALNALQDGMEAAQDAEDFQRLLNLLRKLAEAVGAPEPTPLEVQELVERAKLTANYDPNEARGEGGKWTSGGGGGPGSKVGAAVTGAGQAVKGVGSWIQKGAALAAKGIAHLGRGAQELALHAAVKGQDALERAVNAVSPAGHEETVKGLVLDTAVGLAQRALFGVTMGDVASFTSFEQDELLSAGTWALSTAYTKAKQKLGLTHNIFVLNALSPEQAQQVGLHVKQAVVEMLAALGIPANKIPFKPTDILEALQGEGGQWQIHNYDPEQPREHGRFAHVASSLVDKGRESGKEHGQATDDRGALIGPEMVSDEVGGAVDMPVGIGLDKEGSNLTFHHNHPDNSSFSAQDLGSFVDRPGLTTLYAHTHDGTSYEASPVEGKRRELWLRSHQIYTDDAQRIKDKYLDNPESFDRQKYYQELIASARKLPQQLADEGLLHYKIHRPTTNAEQRDSHGRFTAGGEGSSSSSLLGKLGAAGKWVKARTKQLYDKMEKRYGRATALGIFVAGHAVGLATPLAIIPGSTLLGMAPFAAAAEVVHQVKHLVGNESKPELPPGAVEEFLREMQDITREAAAKFPEHAEPTGNAAWEQEQRGEHGRWTKGGSRLEQTKAVHEEAKARLTEHEASPGFFEGSSEHRRLKRAVADTKDAYLDAFADDFAPAEEQSRPPASEEVSQEVHDAAPSYLTDKAQGLIAVAHSWEKTKPWTASEEQVRSGEVPGLRFEHRPHGEEARYYNGEVHVTPKFFQMGEEGRRHVVYHELGHQLADTMVADGTSFQLHDAGVIPAKHDLGSGTGGGHGDEEALADSYALLHTDPKWLHERYPKMARIVEDRARALGMPLPSGVRNEDGTAILLPGGRTGGRVQQVVPPVRQGGYDQGAVRATHPSSPRTVGAVRELAAQTSFQRNTRWASHPADHRIDSLRGHVSHEIDRILGGSWFTKYLTQAYLSGADQAFAENYEPRHRPLFDAAGNVVDMSPIEMQGARDLFFSRLGAKQVGKPVGNHLTSNARHAIRDVGGKFISMKAKLLAQRMADSLKTLGQRITQEVARLAIDAVSQGKSKIWLAKAIKAKVGLETRKALAAADSSLTHAHAEGTLDALEELDVSHVKGVAEIVTAGDNKVCPACQELEGVVLSIGDARGILPRHMRCRCRWLGVKDYHADQLRGQAARTALKRSLAESDAGEWAGKELVENGWHANCWCRIHNAFCPTGPGGGVNPHCSSGTAPTSAAETPVTVMQTTPRTGLTVGTTYTKMHQGQAHVMTVLPVGFQVAHPGGVIKTYPSITAAARGVQGKPIFTSSYKFFGIPRSKPATPAGTAPPISAASTMTPVTPTPTAAPVLVTPAGAVHAATGLPVGATYAKTYGGQKYVLTVTASGFQVMHPTGTVKTFSTLSGASTAIVRGIRGGNQSVNGWNFFGIPRPTPGATHQTPTPSAPVAQTPVATAASRSTIPYQAETSWQTAKPQAGQILNGVPFAPAPPKFWEHVPDVDVKESPHLKPIDRVGVLIKEPDGRVWIVEPTGHFGNRQHTLPGGHVEPGLTVQQNALKEVWEETGLQVRITGHLGDFEDSNNGNNGRLYVGERIGGAPWDAKIEHHIRNPVTGQPAAESENVKLVTTERAAQLLHRTDDLAQLATVHPLPLDTRPNGNVLKKLVNGLQPAARDYLRKEKAKGHKPGNAELHVVQELRGFNDKPTVKSKTDVDALVAAGKHIEMLRGLQGTGTLSAQEIADAFREGTNFPGHGCFGSGTYADSNKGHHNVANSQYSGYGSGGAVLRILFPKDAKIIKQSELEKKVPNNPSAFGGYLGSGGHSAADCWRGVQAALAGYDAIHVDGKSRYHGSYGKGFYIILNRSICVVQKEDAKGHVIS